MVVIFQLLVPLTIVAQVMFLPETPRWLIQRGNRIDAARKSLHRVRDTDQEVEDELLAIREAIEFEAEAISSGYSALWKDRSVRKRLLIAFILNAGQQITGQGTLNSYSTIIYKKVFTSSSQIALINALNATFAIFFTMNATWTVDRFGRKFLLIVGGIGMVRLQCYPECRKTTDERLGSLYAYSCNRRDADPNTAWCKDCACGHLHRLPHVSFRFLLYAPTLPCRSSSPLIQHQTNPPGALQSGSGHLKSSP